MPCHASAGHQPNTCAWQPARPSFECVNGCKSAFKGAKVQPGEALPVFPICVAQMAFRVLCPARFEKGAKGSADTAEAGSISWLKMNSEQSREVFIEYPHAEDTRSCRMPEEGGTPSLKTTQAVSALLEGPQEITFHLPFV